MYCVYIYEIFVLYYIILSAVSLDEIICLHNEGGTTAIGYPTKVFPNEKTYKDSKEKIEEL